MEQVIQKDDLQAAEQIRMYITEQKNYISTSTEAGTIF